MITGLTEIRAYCGRKTLAGFTAAQKRAVRDLAGVFNAVLARDGLGINLTSLLERSLSLAGNREHGLQIEDLQLACRTGQKELDAFFMGEADDESRTRFPMGNLAFRALVEVARGWDKWEPHAHFVASLSPDFVYHGIVSRIAAGLATPAELRKTGGLAEFLPSIEGGEVNEFFRKYSYRRLSIYRPEDLYLGVQNAAWQHFMDGVTDLELRLPLLFEFPIDQALDAAHKALKETEAAAGKLLKKSFRTELIFNVYGKERATYKIAEKPVVQAALTALISARSDRARRLDRIYGIDLALPHDFPATDPEAYRSYADFFEQARRAGLMRTAHMNELWKYGEEELAALNCLAKVADLFDLNRVGHALVLDPIWFNLVDSPSAFSVRREEVITDFRRRGIMIESCPATNCGQYDPTILRFGRHPFHSWINEGMLDMVALAVDDPWILPASLSQVIAKLLLSNPDGLTFETVKTASSKRTLAPQG